jgi:DNA-binding XRE family transcriptional regulator
LTIPYEFKLIRCGDPDWSPEDRARHKAIRERFQRERPSIEQLVESGEYLEPVNHSTYMSLHVVIHEMKKAREAAGLPLSDLASQIPLAIDDLVKFEKGIAFETSIHVLMRYAHLLGKRLSFTIDDE